MTGAVYEQLRLDSGKVLFIFVYNKPSSGLSLNSSAQLLNKSSSNIILCSWTNYEPEFKYI